MSLKETRRRMLPSPDLRAEASSLTILWVLGLGFGRFGTIAPALKVRSERNESLSEANFRNALSKSWSFSTPLPAICIPFIVALLLLLSVPFLSGVEEIEAMERRASSERRERRW